MRRRTPYAANGALARRLSLTLVLAAIVALGAATAQAGAAIGFGKSQLDIPSSLLPSGKSFARPTSLQFGPDGRLYVSEQSGEIWVFNVKRTGPNDYDVTKAELIQAVQKIPNHDDDGSLNTSVTNRQVTGILVRGSKDNPVVFVTSSDPRIGGGNTNPKGDLNLDTNSGVLTRLRWNGSAWKKLDLVRGLPRSEENHAPNGMALSGSYTKGKLYIAQGGNTNKGAPSPAFAGLPEVALSAAILEVDLEQIGGKTYNLPTLNDPVGDPSDPFGGNDGKNQAKIVPNGPVQVFSPGYRNAYDILIAANGKKYTIDNGGNGGWGAEPNPEGPSGNCTNDDPNSGGSSDQDALHLITGKGYYGGHPNPTRANTNNKFGGQSPVPSGNAIECDYRDADTNETTSLTQFDSSTNGLVDYRASNFGGELKGDILAAGYNSNAVYRIGLNGTGTAVNLNTELFSNVDVLPLDVTTQPDNKKFPGTVWVADVGSENIWAFEPNDFGGGGGPACSGADSNTLDEDKDGYKNSDEIDNGTDPCSAGDVPPDWDKDKVSNLNDPNDDNDAFRDTSDPYAIERSNGMRRSVPVRFTWDNNAPNPGGLCRIGFRGVMTDAKTNYENLIDCDDIVPGGAAGQVTIQTVPSGDALGATNTQKNGFQIGFKPPGGTFTAHTRVTAPFFGGTPSGKESLGLAIGRGDQDNYFKLVVSARNGDPGVELLKEVSGQGTPAGVPVDFGDADFVDLYLTVNPRTRSVRSSFAVTENGTSGGRTFIGLPRKIPRSWLEGTTGFAVGLISTSAGGSPFAATWDFIEAVKGNGVPRPRMTKPKARLRTGRSFTVAWRASTLIDLSSYDVRVRKTSRSGRVGQWRLWRKQTTARQATFTGRRGQTYCFAARARAADGMISAWGGRRCTTIRR